MATTPHRLLACVLLLVQAMASIGAGRTLCIPLDECVHTIATCDADAGRHDHAAPATGHCCSDHAHGTGHRHDHHHPATPTSTDEADPDCGCHLHLPLPERVDPVSTGVTIMPVIMIPSTPCRIMTPCDTGAAEIIDARPDREAWLGTAEVRARDVTSLRV